MILTRKAFIQRTGAILIACMIGTTLLACSNGTLNEDDTNSVQTDSNSAAEEPSQEETKVDKEVKQEEILLTHDEFIKQWNKTVEENGLVDYQLNTEFETLSSGDGEIVEMGLISIGDSYQVVLNPNDKVIQKVSLNLSYPVEEDPDSKHIHDVTKILMKVLQPTLTEEALNSNLNELGVSTNDYSSEEVTVVEGEVTYKISNQDDRFWLDAVIDHS
ncbi:hypothetical protein JOC75_004323 [Metabacillus crassostreae]|uniref:hypothetical protein n=1 Tax=Metabacillus crassostreae TaxID=929098 RepID=UPI00195D00EE|nr:hypothetical protein [Metabacillus crassostreae]MBM7606275.1 hypothetical protein [Metabacillus crassostreae]